jgi:hypothetical protein
MASDGVFFRSAGQLNMAHIPHPQSTLCRYLGRRKFSILQDAPFTLATWTSPTAGDIDEIVSSGFFVTGSLDVPKQEWAKAQLVISPPSGKCCCSFSH